MRLRLLYYNIEKVLLSSCPPKAAKKRFFLLFLGDLMEESSGIRSELSINIIYFFY